LEKELYGIALHPQRCFVAFQRYSSGALLYSDKVRCQLLLARSANYVARTTLARTLTLALSALVLRRLALVASVDIVATGRNYTILLLLRDCKVNLLNTTDNLRRVVLLIQELGKSKAYLLSEYVLINPVPDLIAWVTAPDKAIFVGMIKPLNIVKELVRLIGIINSLSNLVKDEIVEVRHLGKQRQGKKGQYSWKVEPW